MPQVEIDGLYSAAVERDDVVSLEWVVRRFAQHACHTSGSGSSCGSTATCELCCPPMIASCAATEAGGINACCCRTLRIQAL